MRYCRRLVAAVAPLAGIACGPPTPAPVHPESIPTLEPLPPELEVVHDLADCSYRSGKRCLAPPEADGSDSDRQRFRVKAPCGKQVAAELDGWAESPPLEFVSGSVSARRVVRFYIPEPQSFIEVYYSVLDDGKDVAEVFVGVVGSSPKLRRRVKQDHGSPNTIANRMRNVAERCESKD